MSKIYSTLYLNLDKSAYIDLFIHALDFHKGNDHQIKKVVY